MMISETIRTQAHPALLVTADAATAAYRRAVDGYSREKLRSIEMEGADGTPTMFVDVLVEDAIIAAARSIGVNVLSEERGWVDVGSSVTLVVDPVDGSANAAAGVPLSCFSAAVVEDGEFSEALTSWLHTDERWWASRGYSPYRTSGCTGVAEAAVSMLRPHRRNWDAWTRVAERASRVRILSCSTIDAAFVATGAVDAFVDAGSDTHRLMDIAAAVVLVGASGGVVLDARDRPIEFDIDLTRRWSGIVAATEELGEELRGLITA
ncbi:inositol monophosphatase [Rhodococcus triatomae]|uniref:Myo-inositol-1(Or 4)-monophosphatase n=1 Tax=Rhodococcus triatomae TaxID=300028 RepID=A0A1G8LJ40_9NOCA|nr:inositol monophosphatase family protein [Rhodococcus triatomae]QNG20603.1 inositol monophosphatase [Rhodococcus triatomae]QNG23479.1 inositol monophosphatase [Rhodococcus triatomae]SDI55668.1 myo-inositol-1(or 4)-monophosphatase [Rhodococcus triatomae]